MKLGKYSILLLVLVILLCATPNRPTQAKQEQLTAPPGFKEISSSPGVTLFRKDYPNGTPDFVQVVDLRNGGAIELMHGTIAQPRQGRGVYGGDDPRFSFMSLEDFWREASKEGQELFCVTNGSFFYMRENPTRLAFPLKVDGKVLTDGFGYRQYSDDEKQILEIFADRVNIIPFSKNALYGSNAPDLITGLTEDANKRAKYSVGRTFVGVADGDGDNVFELALILNTSTSIQSDVAEVLRAFGSREVMMLDGGGSTQLMCDGQHFVKSDRLIPQAIAVYAGQLPPVSASTPSRTAWLIALEAESLPLSIDIINTGKEAWLPGEHEFVLESSPLGAKTTFEFKEEVKPGATATFQHSLIGYSQPGKYSVPLNWYISHNQIIFPGEPLQLRVVVLPSEQGDLQSDLRHLVDGLDGKPDEEIETTLNEALQSERKTLGTLADYSAGSDKLRDILLVPALMLPALLFVFLIVQRIRQ